MVRTWQLLVCWVLLVGVAAGDNEIFGWSSNPPETPGFAIVQESQTVTISLPGSYIFWATDDADPDGLGQIKKIWVHSGDEQNPEVAGTVGVSVFQWWTQENGPAARDVWEIDLSNSSDGRLNLVRIAGNYGDLVFGGTLRADGVQTLDIGASVLKPIQIDGGISALLIESDVEAAISANAISGDVFVGGDVLAQITLGDVDGDIEVGGGVDWFSPVSAGNVGGSVTIDGDVISALHFTRVAGCLTLHGTLWSPLTVESTVEELNLLSTVGTHADITVGGDVYSAHIVGPFSGALYLGGLSRGGHILAEDDLEDLELFGFPAGAEVTCLGTVGQARFVHPYGGDIGGNASFGAADHLGFTINGDGKISGTWTTTGRVGGMSALCEGLSGTMEFGELGGGIFANVYGHLQVNGGITGSFNCNQVSGEFDVGAVCEGATLYVHSIARDDSESGHLQIGEVIGAVEAGDVQGDLVVTGQVEGTLAISQALTGTLTISGDLAGAATLPCGTTANISLGSLSGELDIGNADCIGDTAFAGSIAVANVMGGNIYLWNGFAHNAALDPDVPEVQIGTKATDAMFIVNVDGRDRGDEYWQSDAAVKIGTADPYTGPNEANNLWAATCCKADTDGSGSVNSFDIDPFVLMLTSPEDYRAAYYWLELSDVYRCDLNCDGEVNSFDISPFTLKLTSPTSWYLAYPVNCDDYNYECCPGCTTGGRAGEGAFEAAEFDQSPSEVAALWAAGVAPERSAALLAIVQDVATRSSDASEREFWTAVAAELSGE